MTWRALLPDNGLHGNNQISGEAQDVLWKLEECKVRIADHPSPTREEAARSAGRVHWPVSVSPNGSAKLAEVSLLICVSAGFQLYDTIPISVAEDGRNNPVRFIVIPNQSDDIAKMAKCLAKHGELDFCYEAGSWLSRVGSFRATQAAE